MRYEDPGALVTTAMHHLWPTGRDLVAVAFAAVAYIVLGAIWYARPIFGRVWARGLGMPDDYQPAPGQMLRSLFIMVIASVALMYVLKLAVLAVTPEVWLHGTNSPEADAGVDLARALGLAGLVWVGFFVPSLLTGRAFENRAWSVLAVNGGYSLAGLLVGATIYTYVHA